MSLAGALSRVAALKGVASAALVSAGGEVLHSAGDDPGRSATAAAAVTAALASSRALAELLGDGEVQQAMLEYANGPLLLAPLHPSPAAPVAVVALEPAGHLGRVRFGLRRLLPLLAEAAAGSAADTAPEAGDPGASDVSRAPQEALRAPAGPVQEVEP